MIYFPYIIMSGSLDFVLLIVLRFSGHLENVNVISYDLHCVQVINSAFSKRRTNIFVIVCPNLFIALIFGIQTRLLNFLTLNSEEEGLILQRTFKV